LHGCTTALISFKMDAVPDTSIVPVYQTDDNQTTVMQSVVKQCPISHDPSDKTEHFSAGIIFSRMIP